MVDWSKLVKRFVALGLVGGIGGSWVYDRIVLSASYAVVAAPTVEIDAPCDGVLTQHLPPFSILPAGALLGAVKPTPLDDPEQRGAQAELETSRADVASLKRLIDLGEEMR